MAATVMQRVVPYDERTENSIHTDVVWRVKEFRRQEMEFFGKVNYG